MAVVDSPLRVNVVFCWEIESEVIMLLMSS